MYILHISPPKDFVSINTPPPINISTYGPHKIVKQPIIQYE